MSTYIAYGNIHTFFDFESIYKENVPPKLHNISSDNPRVMQRHQCRRLAHFLLWHLLKMAGKSPALLSAIQRTPSGRPYFSNEPLDFNISHSGDWVAVMLKTGNRQQSVVGIDIELSKTRRFSALLAHFAPKAEVDWLTRQPNAETAFYRCWCLREAILKSQGVGIVKLSEVTHLPEEQQINSDYCPKGTLWFTDELPFYLAFFENQPENSPHFFQWTGEQLQNIQLNAPIIYQVNKKR